MKNADLLDLRRYSSCQKFCLIEIPQDMHGLVMLWWDSPAAGGIACPWRTGKMPVPTESCSLSNIVLGNQYSRDYSG
jgi:hypothetical protein